MSDPAPLPPPIPPVPSDAPTPPDPSLVPELTALPDPNLTPAVQGEPNRNRETAPEEARRKPEPDEDGGGGGKPETYTIPGFYGQAPTTYTAGAGRLALPKFRSSLSLGVGYDDNPQTQTQSFDDGDSDSGSAFASIDFSTSYQKARHREIFLWSGDAGASIYSQNADPSYNISLGMSYQRRFVRPFNFSANVAFNYSNEPQYGQQGYIRAPRDEEDLGEDSSSGALNASVMLNFSSRWTPQFNTVTSLSGSTSLYGGSREEDNGVSFTFGNAFRYRVDRYTWVVDLRYQTSTYDNGGVADSDTVYALGGVDWHLGPWLVVTSRLGASYRSYSDGASVGDPYGEFAVTFNPNAQNSFNFSARYGLETNAAGEGDSNTFRVGVAYSRVFTSRLNGTLSLNYTNSGATIAGSTTEADASSFGGETIFDATVAFNYRLTSRISLSASASCTRGSGGGSSDTSDPDQNRVQLNAVYSF